MLSLHDSMSLSPAVINTMNQTNGLAMNTIAPIDRIGSRGNSQTNSGSSDDEKAKSQYSGTKIKRRRHRQIGSVGEGRGNWSLRTTCDGCTLSKVRCNGNRPCSRCVRRNENCIYSEKRRCGPKRRKQGFSEVKRVPVTIAASVVPLKVSPEFQYSPHQIPMLHSSASSNSAESSLEMFAPTNAPLTSISPIYNGPSSLTGYQGLISSPNLNLYGNGTFSISADEQYCLSVYITTINGFLPIVSAPMLRGAMLSEPLSDQTSLGLWLPCSKSSENTIFYAFKAILWGCIAIGAQYLGEIEKSEIYFNKAHMNVQHCFDAAIPEAAAFYLLFVLYHIHLLDKSKIFKFMGFAQQTFTLLSPQDQAANCEIASCIRLLSTLLHIGYDKSISAYTINSYSPDPASLRQIGYCEQFDGQTRSNIINSICQAMVHVDKSSRGEHTESSDKAMYILMCEADHLVTRASRAKDFEQHCPPSDLLIAVVKTIAGFFRLKSGISKEDFFKCTINPVKEALIRTPTIINFPMGYHVCRCVRFFLTNHGDPSHMQKIMEIYEERLLFANMCCDGGQQILDRYKCWTWDEPPSSPPSSPPYIAFPPTLPPSDSAPTSDLGVIPSESMTDLLFRQGSLDMMRIAVPSYDSSSAQGNSPNCFESYIPDHYMNWSEVTNLSKE